MTLTSEEIDAIIFYRRQKSYATLQEANDAMKDAHWNLTIQRLYYAVYYMASALLLKNEIPAQSHNGVVGQIGLHFVTREDCQKNMDVCILVYFKVEYLVIIMIFLILQKKM